MKKTAYFLIIILLILLHFPFGANAADDIDFDNLEEDITGELQDIIDKDIREILEEIGISEFTFEEIYNVSLNNITVFFKDCLKDKIILCFKDFFNLLSIIMLISVVSALFKSNEDDNILYSVSNIIVILLAVSVISESVTAVVSVLELSGKFMLGYAPIYTLIISLAGNTASALTYNTAVMAFAEIISSAISLGAIDIMGIFFCLGISFSMNGSINLNRFINTVNKAVSTVLGLSASLFTGFLSIKSILSVSLDSVSVKGIRFLISSLIPIVGSSISEAYSSLIGSINLIKGSAAIIGILVIVVINVPILLETLMYYISFGVLGYLSESLSSTRLGEVLRFFACGMRILLLLCVFEMFILIISTGIMLSVKGGG